MNNPHVTVIICVYNGRDFIENCLSRVLLQAYHNMDIVVIDDGSTDGTSEILEKYKEHSNVKIHRNGQNLGLGASRNIGVTMADSEIVAYTDADCVVRTNWIEELVKPFVESDEVVIVGGKINDPDPINYWGLVMKGANFLSCRSRYTKKIIGCNMALKRSFVLSNKFDETLRNYGEETDLCHRALRQDYNIFYQDTAEVIHYHRNSFKALIKQRFSLGVGNYYVRIKNGVFPFVSIKGMVLVLTGLFFLLWILGLISFMVPVIFLILYIARVFHEDYRTKRKKLYEVLLSLPGKILITVIEDLGYIWGIFWTIHIKRRKLGTKSFL